MITLHFECLLNDDIKVTLNTNETINDWVIWYQAEDIKHWYKYHIITMCEKMCQPKCELDNCVINMMTAITSYKIEKVKTSDGRRSTSNDFYSIVRTRKMPVPKPRTHYQI